MSNSPDAGDRPSSDPLSTLTQTIFSYNGNVMLAALVSLLVVILFVLLLHLYAKWFLAQARRRRRRPITVSQVLGQTGFPSFHSIVIDSNFSGSSTKGLDPSVIAGIPLFLYESEKQSKNGLQCVVCLSGFEEFEIGRCLPVCNHAFHVECIDMWLISHSNCPICRAPVIGQRGDGGENEARGLIEERNSGNENVIANEHSSVSPSSSSSSSSSCSSSSESVP